MQHYRFLVGGKWMDGSAGEVIETVNPYTGKVWATVARATVDDADAAVEAAYAAFRKGPWASMSPAARGAALRRFADLLADEGQPIAETETRDNGRLISETRPQLRYLPHYVHYYAGLADKIEGAVPPVERPGMFNFTWREPLGVVVAITPWNAPLLLALAKMSPALAAGCTVVIKPSEFTSASTLELARLIGEAGIPDGVVNVVTGYGHDVGAALVSHPKVAKIAFTGSDTAGRSIYQAAAGNLKGVTLELGGKSPNIVFDDCNVEDAVNGSIAGIFGASGQMCIAGSRLLVHDSIHDMFVERLRAAAATAVLGDPMKAETQVGPIATPPQFRKILDYVDIARSEGAELVLGGAQADAGEWFVEPTIFTGVRNDMRIAREEVFGPVLSVIPFRDLDEAIEIANDTLFGLAAGVWTNSMDRAFTVARAVEAGTVWINTYRTASHASPFGGYKRSGIGRENGLEAINGFLQTKSVWLNHGAEVPNPFVMRLS